MRRWRTPDGKFLIEAPLVGDVQYYRLGRDGAVERTYADERASIEDELHTIAFAVMGRQLMCRHLVEKAFAGTDDRSRVEIDKLELLTPDEQPTEREARQAIATFQSGEEAVEAQRKAKIERLAASASAALRPTVRRLAERIVRDDDDIARRMLSMFGALAALHRVGEHDANSLRSATQAVTLAAQLMTFDRAARSTVVRPLADSAALALTDDLEQLRRDLGARAQELDDGADSLSGSANAREYRKASSALKLAVYHLLTGVGLVD